MARQVTIPNTQVHHLTAAGSGYDFQIDVSVPLSYDTSDRRYPVLYLLDSNWYFPMVTSIVQTMMIIPVTHFVQEMIIVGIGYETTDVAMQTGLRSRDYTPTVNDEIVASMREILPWAEIENTSGEAADFLNFIRNEVIPFIDSTYRTDPNTRIGHGHSFGGLFMLYTLFNKPDTFHRYIAASPSIWWDDRIILKHEQAYADTHNDFDRSTVSSGALCR
jgi:predicted alpha/beta superfamily hydrolase